MIGGVGGDGGEEEGWRWVGLGTVDVKRGALSCL